jgi:hypothetical protein
MLKCEQNELHPAQQFKKIFGEIKKKLKDKYNKLRVFKI